MIVTSCTQKNSNDFEDTPLGKSLGCLSDLYECKPPIKNIFFDNKEGMSKRYNESVEDMELVDYKYHIFVHDDVLLSDLFLQEKLEEGFKEFDVIGVAGSTDFSIHRRPLMWHNSARDTWRGSCYHPTNDKEFSYTKVYDTHFGNPGRVSTIDGVFIAIKKEALDKGLKFDPQFEFDFYDLDLCVTANRLDLKVGVIPLALAHYSHGAGINKPSYKVAEELFIKKWSERK